jgi:dihydroorotate dehydrogenase
MIVKKVEGKVPVVSAGGVMTAQDARQRLEAGAALVQVYTGLVYAGPGFIKQLLKS